MSLGIAVKGAEGLVLASESRVTLTVTGAGKTPVQSHFDNATKLFSFCAPNSSVGVITYGQAAVGGRTAHGFVPEFESGLEKKRMRVCDFAKAFSVFMLRQWNENMKKDFKGPDMTFVVGGFDEDDPYGKIFIFDIPKKPEPLEQYEGKNFGIVWGGQREIVDRLIKGFDRRIFSILRDVTGLEADKIGEFSKALEKIQMPIPFPFLPLQDCVDLAVFFIKSTINAQNLTVGLRGCGGSIDVATITRSEGLKFIKKKEITCG